MADTFTISATKRDNSKHSARTCRDSGRVPGVVYGHNVDPHSISVDTSELLKLFRKAGKASLIDLLIEGEKDEKVLIHEVQWEPVQTKMRHIDFYVVNLNEKTTIDVPLVFEGEVPAVKNFGGVFMKDHEYIPIRCLPTDIPHDIKVDISGLENLHDHITIADLNLDSDKFELMKFDPGTVICSVTGRAAEEMEHESTEAEDENKAEAASGEEGKTD